MDNCLKLPRFFQYETHLPDAIKFQPYTMDHLLILLFLVAVMGILFWASRNYSKEQKYKLLLAAGVILFLMQIVNSIWQIYIGHFWEGEGLPLHLCSMQFLILPLALHLKNDVLLDYFCLSGPMGALLFLAMPDTISNSYPLFHYQSFISWPFHGIILFAGIYLLFSYGYRPNIKNFRKVIPLALGLMAIAALGNFTGGNYMFFTTAPKGTPIAFFESVVGWPYYNVMTVLLGFAVFFLEYKLFAFAFRKDRVPQWQKP